MEMARNLRGPADFSMVPPNTINVISLGNRKVRATIGIDSIEMHRSARWVFSLVSSILPSE